MSNAAEVLETQKLSNGETGYHFHFSLNKIHEYYPDDRLIFITDENVFKYYADFFPLQRTVVIPAGEENKNLDTVAKVIEELHEKEAGREDRIIGVGGGVITDLSGFVASIYLRGIKFSFVPTSILAMVDASIGGKNGVDSGPIKNQIGVIRQPLDLFFDFNLLKTLPAQEWISGFAEIIKHACIKDEEMFRDLMDHRIEDLENNPGALERLIRRNVHIKEKVIAQDEFENGIRRMLNFGHTMGHAIETLKQLPHGMAVAIGTVFACRVSEILNNFSPEKTEQIIQLLEQYHLPTSISFDKEAAWELIAFDKKKAGNSFYFITLQNIGQGEIKKIEFSRLKELFFEL